MNYCGNIDDPKYREKVQYLSNILGNESAAIAAIELNNGDNLDLAPNGAESKLFNDILSLFPDSDIDRINKAFKIKATVYAADC